MTSGTTPPLAALLAALALVAGCGTGTDGAREAPPAERPDELGAHDGEPCPDRLPGKDAFGPSDPAPEAPDLSAPERAWVCVYALRDDNRWVRDGRPVEASTGAMPGLADALDGLEPAPADRACTSDLGWRYLLVWSRGGDLTAAAVDSFGCREVRLSDDPHVTPLGEATSGGTVPGVLLAADGLLEAVQAAYDG